MFNDEHLSERTIYITQCSPEELADINERISGVKKTPLCRGRSVGCRCAPTRNERIFGRSHWVGSRDNLSREDFYVIKFNKNLEVKRATICGKCDDSELDKESQYLKKRRAEKKKMQEELDKEVEQLAPLIILLGDRLQKLRTIMTLHGDEARAELIDAFFKNMNGREYLECLQVLGTEEWFNKVKRRPGDTDKDYQTRIKNETRAMINTVIKSVRLSYMLEHIPVETSEQLQATAIVARNRLDNQYGLPHNWLPDTTEGHVYIFLRPYGFEFKTDWMAAMRLAAIEEGLISE